MSEQPYVSEPASYKPYALNQDPARTSVMPGWGTKPSTVFSMFFSCRRASTRATYLCCLRKLAHFLSTSGPEEALCLLISRDQNEAMASILCYKASLKEQGLAPATVNLYLSAIRSAVKFAGILGLVTWRLKVRYEKVLPYRDTCGPGREGVRLMLAELEGDTRIKSFRDRAMLRLMYDLALRVREVTCIDVEDLDLGGKIAHLVAGTV
jgi:site-specific recombinase XerC